MFNITRLFKRRKPNFRSVLFVCTANITRSPLAEALFRDLTLKSGEKWEVASAGTHARFGSPANLNVGHSIGRRKISLSGHRSRPVSKRLLRRYYWIFAMEEAHRLALLRFDSSIGDRIHVLRKFGREDAIEEMDIPDPTPNIGLNGKPQKGEIEDYDLLLRILDEEISRVYDILQDKVYEMESNQD